eukprot:CAMPEP_0194534148 /NCGR_PEP_ID=MMETSP0253-20130528/72225_1 /TAXON_ID=2966 /ORGANISM="Noctiluca scintillans" /LENGTH=169 /DNA_ID=CAMNT_0039379775 /DNA_START=162 /DNA_END=671 /DNA_ORIENTATION=+
MAALMPRVAKTGAMITAAQVVREAILAVSRTFFERSTQYAASSSALEDKASARTTESGTSSKLAEAPNSPQSKKEPPIPEQVAQRSWCDASEGNGAARLVSVPWQMFWRIRRGEEARSSPGLRRDGQLVPKKAAETPGVPQQGALDPAERQRPLARALVATTTHPARRL